MQSTEVEKHENPVASSYIDTIMNPDRENFLPCKKQTLSASFPEDSQPVDTCPSTFAASLETVASTNNNPDNMDTENAEQISEDIDLEKFRKEALWRQFCSLRTTLNDVLVDNSKLEKEILAIKVDAAAIPIFMNLVRDEINWFLQHLPENSDKQAMPTDPSASLHVLFKKYSEKLHHSLLNSLASNSSLEVADKLTQHMLALTKDNRIQTLTSEISIYKEELSKKNGKIEDLQHALFENQRKLQKYKMAKASPEGALSAEKPPSQVGNAQDEKLENLEYQLKCLKNELTNMDTLANERSATIKSLLERESLKQKEIQQLIQKYSLVPDDFKSFLDYHLENTKLVESINLLKNQVDNLRITVDKLEQERLNMIQDHKERETILRSAFENELFQLKESVQVYKRENELLQEKESLAGQKADSIAQTNKGLLEDIETLQKTLAILRKDFNTGSDDLLQEIETIAESYEKVQEKNTQIVKQLGSKEEVLIRLLQDKKMLESKLQDVITTQESERNSTDTMRKNLSQYIEKLESSERTTKEKLALLDNEHNKLKNDIDYYRRKHYEVSTIHQEELGAALKESRGKLSLLQKDVDELRSKNLELSTTQMDLQEKLFKATKKVELYSSMGRDNSAAWTKELEEQLNVYKTLIRCPTCQKKDKTTTLMKCMHVFCKDCIDSRLESRQRKCPTCGEPFSHSEVRTVYL